MLPIEKRADLLKVVAHLVLIKILEDFTQGVKYVSDVEDAFDIGQPNISRHLTLLRTNNIVEYVDGRLKCNFIKNSSCPICSNC